MLKQMNQGKGMPFVAEVSKRNYGIDLLRTISMFMILILHILGNGGILKQVIPLTIYGELIWFIEVCCFCAVNCYGLISGYVGVKAKHKYSNLIYLWIQVFFYLIISAGITCVFSILNSIEMNYAGLIFSLLPVTSGAFWYFSAYFCLFFLMPLLNFLLEKAPRNVLKSCFVVVLVLFCISDPVKENIQFSLDRGYSFVWLAVLYMIGGYIAKYNPFEKISAPKCILGYFLCCIFTMLTRIAIALITKFAFGNIMKADALIEYTFISVLGAAIFLLLAFSKMKFNKKPVCKIISISASAAFGVYIIHTTPFIWDLIKGNFVWCVEYPIIIGLLLVLGCALGMLIVCMIIDIIRGHLFALIRIKRFSVWLEKVFKKIILKACKWLHISLGTESEESNNS